MSIFLRLFTKVFGLVFIIRHNFWHRLLQSREYCSVPLYFGLHDQFLHSQRRPRRYLNVLERQRHQYNEFYNSVALVDVLASRDTIRNLEK